MLAELDGRIPLIVDGGPTTHGLESTIVAVREGGMEILRPGPITAEELASFGEIRPARTREQPEAPGQLPSHYAPRTRLVLTADAASFVLPAGARVGALTLQRRAIEGMAEIRTLSATGDLREAAANLFRCLRELDQAGLDLIVAEEMSGDGLGTAIMDRLRRAAADSATALMSEAGLNEAFEKRMRLVRLALKFRMILAGEKVGVILQLDQLRERAIRRRAGNGEPFFRHPFAVFHVEFVAVPMPLEHFGSGRRFSPPSSRS